MTPISIYQVDAFTEALFSGNPAAICMMDFDLPDQVLQSIAAENNLAETAYVWQTREGFKIRWFTPTIEVDLCGHATLAAAYVIFSLHRAEGSMIKFDSRSGPLYVTQKADNTLELDFPADVFYPVTTPDLIEAALGCTIIESIKGKSDYLVRIRNESTLVSLKPDFSLIKRLPARGLIVTAPGDTIDFVSRCFFPQSGIDEDPVTGSAHTTLTPFWASKLGKTDFVARQVSSRGGDLYCVLKGDRVLIGGHAVLYLEGHIFVKPA